MPETTAEAAAMPAAVEETVRPPRENLVRAAKLGVELRAAADDTANQSATLYGHFAVFNRFTEIDSMWEGNFLERIAPGAFSKTFKEQRDRIRVLLEHGHDPQIGNKPIAEIQDLREDDTGGYYEARLFDGLPDLIVEGLRAGQYGASFRFTVIRDEWVQEPGVSDYNPKGLPERTLREVRVPEFGPVTFGAYQDATADVRSLTDEFIMGRAVSQPERLRAMLDYLERRDASHQTSPDPDGSEENESSERCDEDPAAEAADDSSDTAPSIERAATEHAPADERRTPPNHLYGMSRKETRTWSL